MYFEIQLLLEGQLVGGVLFGPYIAILSLDASAILFSVPVVYRGILLVHGTYSMVVQVPDETAPTVLHGDVRLLSLAYALRRSVLLPFCSTAVDGVLRTYLTA